MNELELLNQIKQEVDGMRSKAIDPWPYDDGVNETCDEVIQYLDKLIAERSEK